MRKSSFFEEACDAALGFSASLLRLGCSCRLDGGLQFLRFRFVLRERLPYRLLFRDCKRLEGSCGHALNQLTQITILVLDLLLLHDTALSAPAAAFHSNGLALCRGRCFFFHRRSCRFFFFCWSVGHFDWEWSARFIVLCR